MLQLHERHPGKPTDLMAKLLPGITRGAQMVRAASTSCGKKTGDGHPVWPNCDLVSQR